MLKVAIKSGDICAGATHGLFYVGPESASAHPGPACYRKGGPLTVTDANLFNGIDIELWGLDHHACNLRCEHMLKVAIKSGDICAGMVDWSISANSVG
jgi:N-methylhydantoinase A/oxoprolinase/acetone carboxylase beta subunit